MTISSQNTYKDANKIFMDLRKLYHVAYFWEMNEAFKTYTEWIKAAEPKNRSIRFIYLTTQNSDVRLQEDYAAETVNFFKNKLIYFEVNDEVRKQAAVNLANLIELDNSGKQNDKGNKYELPYVVRRNYRTVWDKEKSAYRIGQLNKKIEERHFLAADEILEFNIEKESVHGTKSTDLFSRLNKWIILPKTTKVPMKVFRAIKYLYPWLNVEDKATRETIDNDHLVVGNQFIKVEVTEPTVEKLLAYLCSQKNEWNEDIVSRVCTLKNSAKPLETKDLYENLRGLIDSRIWRIIDVIGKNPDKNPLFSNKFYKDRKDLRAYIEDTNSGKFNQSDGELVGVFHESVYETINELVGAKGINKAFTDCLPMNFRHINDRYLKTLPEYVLIIQNIKIMLKSIGYEVVMEAVRKLIFEDNERRTENKKSYWKNLEVKLNKTKNFEKVELTVKRFEQILDKIGIDEGEKQKCIDFLYENKIAQINASRGNAIAKKPSDNMESTLYETICQLSDKVEILQGKNLSKKEMNRIENLKLYLTYEICKILCLCKDDDDIKILNSIIRQKISKLVFSKMLDEMLEISKDKDKLPKPYVVEKELNNGIFTNHRYGEGKKIYIDLTKS